MKMENGYGRLVFLTSSDIVYTGINAKNGYLIDYKKLKRDDNFLNYFSFGINTSYQQAKNLAYSLIPKNFIKDKIKFCSGGYTNFPVKEWIFSFSTPEYDINIILYPKGKLKDLYIVAKNFSASNERIEDEKWLITKSAEILDKINVDKSNIVLDGVEQINITINDGYMKSYVVYYNELINGIPAIGNYIALHFNSRGNLIMYHQSKRIYIDEIKENAQQFRIKSLTSILERYKTKENLQYELLWYKPLYGNESEVKLV